MIDSGAVDQEDGGSTSSSVQTVARPSSGHTKSLLLSISDGGFEVGVDVIVTHKCKAHRKRKTGPALTRVREQPELDWMMHDDEGGTQPPRPSTG